jgi:hypothetical protein
MTHSGHYRSAAMTAAAPLSNDNERRPKCWISIARIRAVVEIRVGSDIMVSSVEVVSRIAAFE